MQITKSVYLMTLGLFCQPQGIASEASGHQHAHMHAEKGLAAAFNFPGYANLCDLNMVFRDVNAPRTARSAKASRSDSDNMGRKPVQRDESRAQVGPMKVFDNLYFVGNAGVSAWLLGDDAGYILIDTLTSNEAAEKYIIGGMQELGLDPTKIKHLIVTHAHGDHYGGHRLFKGKYNLPVTMSETDWQLALTLPEHPRFGPAPDNGVTVKHGETLTVGNSSLTVHVTPGHTMGTISPVFTVYDNGVPYKAALWGGTGFNFGVNPEQFAAYAEAAQRFKKNAMKENVVVFLSNHGKRDGSIEKMEQLAERGEDEPHPFVMGDKALEVFDVLEQCAMAQYDRIKDGQYP